MSGFTAPPPIPEAHEVAVRGGSLTLASGLQAVGGLLLAICMAISSWSVTRIVLHGERIVRNEAELMGVRNAVDRGLDGVQRQLEEIKVELRDTRKRP